MYMAERPVVWDDANRKHLGLDHPEREINLDEITQAMTDPTREEARHPNRTDVWVTKGRTAAGRLLYVAWVEIPQGRYPVHAHAIGRHRR